MKTTNFKIQYGKQYTPNEALQLTLTIFSLNAGFSMENEGIVARKRMRMKGAEWGEYKERNKDKEEPFMKGHATQKGTLIGVRKLICKGLSWQMKKQGMKS